MASPEAKEPTYEVTGGQGHRVLARGLSREQAEELRRKFDNDCARYGLHNPPTRINEETWRR